MTESNLAILEQLNKLRMATDRLQVLESAVYSPVAARTLANGNNDDVSTLGTNALRITGPTAAFTVRGFANGTPGKQLIVENAVAQVMTIANEAAGEATAANRIRCPMNSDVVLAGQYAFLIFFYDSTLLRWILKSPYPNSGTANPAVYPSNIPFWRENLGWWIYYDGTRWLTENEYPSPFERLTFGGVGSSRVLRVRANHAISPTRIAMTTVQTGSPDGSNYYTGIVYSVALDYTAATSVFTFTTLGDAAGAFTTKDGNSTTAAPANYGGFYINVTKVGPNPVTIQIDVNIYYRLIVT